MHHMVDLAGERVRIEATAGGTRRQHEAEAVRQRRRGGLVASHLLAPALENPANGGLGFAEGGSRQRHRQRGKSTQHGAVVGEDRIERGAALEPQDRVADCLDGQPSGLIDGPDLPGRCPPGQRRPNPPANARQVGRHRLAREGGHHHRFARVVFRAVQNRQRPTAEQRLNVPGHGPRALHVGVVDELGRRVRPRDHHRLAPQEPGAEDRPVLTGPPLHESERIAQDGQCLAHEGQPRRPRRQRRAHARFVGCGRAPVKQKNRNARSGVD